MALDKTNLIVNYVPPAMLEHEFRALFDPHGTIAHCKLMIDNKTGRSLGYGFIKFSTESEAQSAINALNGMQIGNKRLKVAISRPPSEDIKNCKVYITNLPPTYDKNAVDALFCKYGDIIESRMLMDPQTGLSKCTAFVQMSTRQQAQAAIDGLNQDTVPGAAKPLYVKFAQDHAKKRRIQEAGMINMAVGAGLMVAAPQAYGPMRQKTFNQQRFDPYGGAYMNMGYAQQGAYMAPVGVAVNPMAQQAASFPPAVSAQLETVNTQQMQAQQGQGMTAPQATYNPQQAQQYATTAPQVTYNPQQAQQYATYQQQQR